MFSVFVIPGEAGNPGSEEVTWGSAFKITESVCHSERSEESSEMAQRDSALSSWMSDVASLGTSLRSE
jgi:hypothetical protein